MIFVGGLSGVGKTSMISALARQDDAIIHLRASALLRNSGVQTAQLRAGQMLENQRRLVAILAKMPIPTNRLGILDGHYVIETLDGVVPVPDEVFDSLGLVGVVVIVAQIPIIAARRKARDPEWHDPGLAEMQLRERTHAALQGKRLSIPFAEIASGDQATFRRIAQEMLAHSTSRRASH